MPNFQSYTHSGLQKSIWNRLGKDGKTDYLYDSALMDQEAQFNSALATDEREWSKMMSDTSHQREVADLISAGLNPVLSANSGANAYTGASATTSADSSNSARIGAISQKRTNKVNKEIAELNNKTQLKIQKLNAKNNLKLAKINQDTAKYSADMSYSGALGSAYQNFLGTKYSVDNNPSAIGFMVQTLNMIADSIDKNHPVLKDILTGNGNKNKPNKNKPNKNHLPKSPY